MNIKYNYQGSDAYIHNIAFIKALLIKCTIDNLPTLPESKEEIMNSVLEYLKSN